MWTAIGMVIAVALLAKGCRALSANANVNPYVDQELRQFSVGAAVTIYRGALVGLDPAGHLKAFEPGDLFVGIAYEESDNSAGAAAATVCRVYVTGDFQYTLTSAALTDRGKAVYATADNAISLAGHPDAYVGRVLHYDTTNTVTIRLKAPGEKPTAADTGSIEIADDFDHYFGEVLTAAGETAVNGLRLDSVGAGITTGAGIAPVAGTANGIVKMLLDNDNEAQNLTIETPTILDYSKGVTFEARLTLHTAGAATDDLHFGLAALPITDTERANPIATTASLLYALFRLTTNGLDLYATSDDNSSVVLTDTTTNVVIDTYNDFKIIIRPAGTVEFWVDGVRQLSTSSFSVGAAGVFCGLINLDKSAGTGVPNVYVDSIRVAGGRA